MLESGPACMVPEVRSVESALDCWDSLFGLAGTALGD